MTKLFFTFLFAVAAAYMQAQSVGIGTTSPNTNAALDINSNTKGLLLPRTSATNRNAIINPPKGLIVYDTSFSALYYYDGGRLMPVSEKNYDSATIDYSNAASVGTNFLASSGNTVISSLENSGFFYDNGGATGNYLANSNSSASINLNDETLSIKINIEEMNVETFYDSLFIIYGSSFFDANTLDTIGISGTQLGSYSFNTNVKILFKSNGIIQLSGFKIRWARVKINTDMPEQIPNYGWYYNNTKQAMLGGAAKFNNWHNDSIGTGSFNYGIGAKAKGENSIAMGKSAWATNLGAIAIGEDAKAFGIGAISIGNNFNKATGDNSIAFGNNADAIGEGSIAIGFNSNANEPSAIVIGNYSSVIASLGTAIGANATATDLGAIALGYAAKANGSYATAFTSAVANGMHSISSGLSNYANGYSGFVTGMYSDSIVTRQTSVTATTPLFIIGNGNTAIDRSNALVVLKNGNVAIGDNGNPVNKLQITGTISNVSLLDNSGMMTIGYTSSTNMVIDQNDVQVRLSGAASDLYLQRLGGNIGIGNTGVPAYLLELSTNSAGKPGSNTWSIASDSRLKQNINAYTQGLEQLLQIKPVTYHYNEQSGFDTKPEYVGIIAQDLQKIAPYMVSTVKRKDAEYLSVDNGAMTYMLINAVKEQQTQIEKLKAEIEMLKKKL